MRREKRSKQLFLAVVVFGPIAALLSLLSGPQAPPDFAAMCDQNKPFFVAAAYRAQSASNRAPDAQAPSVVVFQDTPRDSAHYELANFRSTGAVWGLAYAGTEGAIYASTYHKRGLPYGPEGAGGIYRIDLATGDAKPFVTVPSAGVKQRGASMSNGSFDFDAAAAKKVGKTALGGLDLNTDGTELFVMNLEDRHIYRYAVPSGTPLGNYYHGAALEEWGRDARPFGLAWFGDHLYHGVINARGTGSSFVAKVYRSNADGSEMTEVVNLPLRYKRDTIRNLSTLRGGTIMWGPWTDVVADDPTEQLVDRMHVPQPMLTDIAFTPDGRMSLGFRDRYSDMVTQWVVEARETATVTHGSQAPEPPPVINVMSEAGLGFGDLLYGERNPDGTYTVNTEPEHFDDTNGMNHDESSLGGLACIVNTNSIAVTAFGIDKANNEKVVGDEGVFLYDVPTGNKTGHEALQRPGSFLPYARLLTGAKAWAHGPWFDLIYRYEWYRDVGSLGDIETLCGACVLGEVPPTPTVATDTPEPPTETPVSPDTPTATPTDTPTATPTDTPTATPTDTPTATPTPGPVFLPILLKEAPCSVQIHADVVLVIDASLSMAGAKAQAAKDAATAFVDALHLPEDRVGVVAFNSAAQVVSPITGDPAALKGAIAGIKLAAGTRIDTGLEAATTELDAAGTRPNVTQMVIVLTDGIQSAELDRPVALAAALRDRGVVVHVVGLGDDVQAAYLAQVAGDITRVHLAPDATELTNIYLDIARVIPCPATTWWGRR